MIAALEAGRTGYSPGAGEEVLRSKLAERYTRSSGRPISSDQVLCFPGTQTALYAVMQAIAAENNLSETAFHGTKTDAQGVSKILVTCSGSFQKCDCL